MKKLIGLLFLMISTSGISQFAEKSKNFQKYNGYFDFLYDVKTDKIYLEVTDLYTEFLYVYSLSSGIGSNDIGLDRGQLGNEQVVYFKKAGNKLLLVQPNLKYRALTDNVLEKKSVEQAFATSILFGFPIEDEKNGKYIIDISDFLMQDAHGVASRLQSSGQGNYSLDKTKSAIDLARTKNFPKNSEFDVILTFKGDAKGREIRSVSPNSGLVTVAQHHSFIALPDDQYKKRAFDTRSGSYPFSYYDYSTPVQEPILKQFITRHRLEKKNPNEAISEAVEPIIYYLDNGTPEPVRSALLEGGRWWNQAFEAIGYKDAFQLKMLPDDADPLDVRYNVIQWVHRSTRGWSYGSSITDPRTGEIIKGHVSLGSLRIRQDFLIAQALMDQPFKDRDDNYQPMLEMAIARIRQLSAHEIGHTLGFAHNYAASTNNKASVMDYPHPQFEIKRGKIDFSNAYASGIGDWDKVTVAYSYADFNGKDEENELNTILEKASEKGLRYITDQDARPAGSAHALAHLWDNGTNISEELNEVLKIRKLGMDNFSINNIKKGESYSVLEDVFVPLYFFHRYQTEAVAKQIGGLEYNYAVKGDGQEVVKILDSKIQNQALNSILTTLNAEIIAVPKEKLALFPPRAFGYAASRESIKGRMGVGFDPISAAETSADMTLDFLLHSERASRLILQKSLDDKNLSLENVIDKVIANTINRETNKDNYLNEVQRAINYRALHHLMNLAAQDKVLSQVNVIANFKLNELKKSLMPKSDLFSFEAVKRIEEFQQYPEKFMVIPAATIPDGSPIGMGCFH
ncbi:MAG: zinc-dependent metalloprotease [Cellulophaga sp.]|nr:zinc-dependent metalloprotease [Cellulophaga sp.]